jgi:hypothetical protein
MKFTLGSRKKGTILMTINEQAHWETANEARDPVNAREEWLRQEHERRAARLGEFRATEWEEIAGEYADASGNIPHYKCLQLMEDTYSQGRTDARHPLDQLKEIP